MFKVLLLNPPGEDLYLRDQHCSSVSKANYYWPPIDLIMLSGILSEKFKVTVIDAIIKNIDKDECLQMIEAEKPDYVIFVTGYSSWLGDFAFAEKIKDKTKAKVIASGGFLRANHVDVMKKFSFLDAILMDYTSSSTIDYIEERYELVKDMCIRIKDEVHNKPLSMAKEFSIPVPLHELFPLEKYRLPHNRYRPFTSVLTNYGCPYQCSFCIAAREHFKYRPVENVITELRKLVDLGIREIFFKDFTFGVPKNIARKLCEEIIEKLPGLSWICSSRVDVLDEEMLMLMKKAGCHTIQFGVESASQVLLDINQKKSTIEQINRVFSLCRKNGIKTLAHFILGLPGETEESLKKTVKLSKEIKCDYASFNIAIPVYGTELREKCIENGWIKDNAEEFDPSRGFPIIETPQLSSERLWRLRNYALRSFYLRPSFIIYKLFSVKSLYDLRFLFKEGFALLGSMKR